MILRPRPCASRHPKYFGYKLVLLCTPAGVPAAYDLVPASTDARGAGEPVLDWVWGARILGDKGFLGADWQQGYRETRGLEIPAPPARQPAPGPTGRLRAVAQSSAEAHRKGLPRGAEHRPPPGHPACRTLQGLRTHVAAKMTSHAPGSCFAVRPGLTSALSPWPCNSTLGVWSMFPHRHLLRFRCLPTPAPGHVVRHQPHEAGAPVSGFSPRAGRAPGRLMPAGISGSRAQRPGLCPRSSRRQAAPASGARVQACDYRLMLLFASVHD